MTVVAAFGFYERWQAAGYHDLMPIGAPQPCAITNVDFIAPPAGKSKGRARLCACKLTGQWYRKRMRQHDSLQRAYALPVVPVMTFSVQPSPELPILPRVGIRFACPLDVNQEMRTTWLGLGPMGIP